MVVVLSVVMWLWLWSRYIVPLHYHLLLHPDLTSLTFSGSVRILVLFQNDTNWVVLHSKGLTVTAATVLDQNMAHLSDQVGPSVTSPDRKTDRQTDR